MSLPPPLSTHGSASMNRLSRECQDIVTHALVARRRELQLQAAFRPGPSFLRDDLTHVFVEAAKARLQETEAAMRELNQQTIPWLHCHPDCADLFPSNMPPSGKAQLPLADTKVEAA